jgi:dTDP-4-amino-4,6-dideoxygalactose transaminase
LVNELEQRLGERLGTPLQFVSNGTVALQLAIHALELSGSVITTPFSYVATTNVLLWEGLTPLFVDVEVDYLTLDPKLVEEAIRPDTTAILATHVYGYPCRHERLEAIARKYGLALIYDAAHAFDVRVGGQSVLGYGDVSTLSFHATKVFHTIEGGGVLSSDPALLQKLNLLRTFGHVGRDYQSQGINGKNTEFHAAVGLLNLDRLAANREARKTISERYRRQLSELPLRTLDPAAYPGDLHYNYAYFPVFCPDENCRERLVKEMNAQNIYPRRYFEPSLNELPFLDQELRVACPVSERAAHTVLCLPLYPDLPLEDVDRICAIIHASMVPA